MAKINIIGRGIDPAKHLTLSAIKLLQKSDKIIGIEYEKGFWNELRNEFNIPEIEDISHLYSTDDVDINNYFRFIDLVLDYSLTFSNLALLIPGHPRLGVTFIELLKEQAPKTTEFEIIEGISSFDVMISGLNLDPLEQGSALLDANRMLLFRYNLEPAISYFIYHVCSVGNPITNFINPSEMNRIDLLKKYLLNFYDKNKEIYLCRMSNGILERSSIKNYMVSELESSQFDFSTTLYIPANKPSQIDWDFLKLVRN